MVYIYTIKCPKTNLVRYVGKTINTKERFKKHLSENNNTLKSKWIKGLRSSGLVPVFDIIDECGKENWQDKERAYIILFKSLGANLLNQMPGGEGGPTMLGKKLTKDQRDKISNSKKGKPNKGVSVYNKMTKSKSINQYDMFGNFIMSHKSINDAAKHIGRCSRRIQMMVSSKGKTVNHVGGYRFSIS